MNTNPFEEFEAFEKLYEDQINAEVIVVKKAKEDAWLKYVKAVKLDEACKNVEILDTLKKMYFAGFDDGGIYMSIRIAQSMVESLENKQPTPNRYNHCSS